MNFRFLSLTFASIGLISLAGCLASSRNSTQLEGLSSRPRPSSNLTLVNHNSTVLKGKISSIPQNATIAHKTKLVHKILRKVIHKKPNETHANVTRIAKVSTKPLQKTVSIADQLLDGLLKNVTLTKRPIKAHPTKATVRKIINKDVTSKRPVVVLATLEPTRPAITATVRSTVRVRYVKKPIKHTSSPTSKQIRLCCHTTPPSATQTVQTIPKTTKGAIIFTTSAPTTTMRIPALITAPILPKSPPLPPVTTTPPIQPVSSLTESPQVVYNNVPSTGNTTEHTSSYIAPKTAPIQAYLPAPAQVEPISTGVDASGLASVIRSVAKEPSKANLTESGPVRQPANIMPINKQLLAWLANERVRHQSSDMNRRRELQQQRLDLMIGQQSLATRQMQIGAQGLSNIGRPDVQENLVWRDDTSASSSDQLDDRWNIRHRLRDRMDQVRAMGQLMQRGIR